MKTLVRSLKILSVNAAILAAILIGAEGCVRLLHPEIPPAATQRSLLVDNAYGSSHGLNPGATGRSHGATFRIDGDGFIVYSDSSVATADWLLLGDSVTMGIGVEPDSTFAGRIATATDRFRILNPSAIGYSSRNYVAVLERLAQHPGLEIRRITVLWCLNDIYMEPRDASGVVGLRKVGYPVRQFLYRHVRSYQWLKAQVLDRPRAYFEYDRRFYDSESPAFERAVEDLLRLKMLADSMGASLDVISLPYEYQLRSGDFGPQRLLSEALDERSIAFHNAAPALMRTDPKDLFLYGDGIHLSARGHREIARYVLTIDVSRPSGIGS